MPTWQVVVLGIGTVFVVLVCIIGICNLMSLIVSKFVKEPAPVVSAPVATQQTVGNEEKKQIIIAICVAIAEQTGVDVSKIRIHSIKKV